MRRILFLTCIGSLALALSAAGAAKDKRTHKSARGKDSQSAHVLSSKGSSQVGRAGHAAVTRHSSAPRASHSVARASHSPRRSDMNTARASSTRTAQTHSRAAAHREKSVADARHPRSSHVTTAARTGSARTERANARAAANRERNLARAGNERINREAAARTRAAQTNVTNASRSNLAANRGRNMTVGRNVAVNRGGGNVRVVNNWRSDRFRGSDYSAFYNYSRSWHDRSWWTNNYSRIVFVLGGWWYWNAGYWYPAWGYAPYAHYPYDGPIYGYGELTPDQIIANVQIQLQRDGYYVGAIDGVLGSQTRWALAAFQADHGLAITSAVDQPTLATLGLT